jgi:hypothetical protein
MGEIKSTLELVMERTRHLSLSDEERREQALSDFRKALSGMIQKFLDGAFSLERFNDEFESLELGSGIRDRRILVDLVEDRLDLGGDNERLLVLLRESCGLNVQAVSDILGGYAESMRAESGRRSEELKRDLFEKRGIHGSSVLVNLAADDSWRSREEALGNQFSKSLAQEFRRLKSQIA